MPHRRHLLDLEPGEQVLVLGKLGGPHLGLQGRHLDGLAREGESDGVRSAGSAGGIG
ncbi:MAG: hypothetical protein Q4F67_02585 [Propionibacteriaceae bacterium]|nr:hypothetical protein [Propionibacteriaceae bacterium]